MMATLLDVLITFVGTMLVLALAAQSLQELAKLIVATKSRTRMEALVGLIREAVTAAGAEPGPAAPPKLGHRLGRWFGKFTRTPDEARARAVQATGAEALATALLGRLHGLGQTGVRPGALRLDALNALSLAELLRSLDPGLLAPRAGEAKTGQTLLDAVAGKAEQWFDLAMAPIEARYRRRMRGWSFAWASVVVLALNADAVVILTRARIDPAFREQATQVTGAIRALDQARDSLAGSDAGLADSLMRAELRTARAAAWTGGFLGTPRQWRLGDASWWVGIVASILLVSLGAPFWHDALELLFGLKGRLRVDRGPGTAPDQH
jgi:hypothetical protein